MNYSEIPHSPERNLGSCEVSIPADLIAKYTAPGDVNAYNYRIIFEKGRTRLAFTTAEATAATGAKDDFQEIERSSAVKILLEFQRLVTSEMVSTERRLSLLKIRAAFLLEALAKIKQ